MIVDQFDEMLEQAEEQPLVMGMALHAYVAGQPFRLRHLRRALCTSRRIATRVARDFRADIARHFADVKA